MPISDILSLVNYALILAIILAKKNRANLIKLSKKTTSKASKTSITR